MSSTIQVHGLTVSLNDRGDLNYIAVDKNGAVYGYKFKPYIRLFSKEWSSAYVSTQRFIGYVSDDLKENYRLCWRDSLVDLTWVYPEPLTSFEMDVEAVINGIRYNLPSGSSIRIEPVVGGGHGVYYSNNGNSWKSIDERNIPRIVKLLEVMKKNEETVKQLLG